MHPKFQLCYDWISVLHLTRRMKTWQTGDVGLSCKVLNIRKCSLEDGDFFVSLSNCDSEPCRGPSRLHSWDTFVQPLYAPTGPDHVVLVHLLPKYIFYNRDLLCFD